MRLESREEMTVRNGQYEPAVGYSTVDTENLPSPIDPRLHNGASAAPAGELLSRRNSIRARANGTSSSMQSLTVPAAIIFDQNRQLSPRLAPSSPSRPASRTDSVAEIEPLPKLERSASPRV